MRPENACMLSHTPPASFYGEDVAYIHDTGHSDYALGSAAGLLRILRRNGVKRGLVADLGCGSGRWARELGRNGYGVLGIDRSAALLKLARQIAPGARFIAGSLWTTKLPACDAVTSIGECINYDPGAGNVPEKLFGRVREALRPGGVFVFDAAGPLRAPTAGPRKFWREEADWAMLVETSGNRNRKILTRRIVSFRKIGRGYRRMEEVHRLRLYEPEMLLRG
jgi:SAM-dependent methyltransferase